MFVPVPRDWVSLSFECLHHSNVKIPAPTSDAIYGLHQWFLGFFLCTCCGSQAIRFLFSSLENLTVWIFFFFFFFTECVEALHSGGPLWSKFKAIWANSCPRWSDTDRYESSLHTCRRTVSDWSCVSSVCIFIFFRSAWLPSSFSDKHLPWHL